VTCGHTFLVERYIPRLCVNDVERLVQRLAAATAQLRAEGRDVRWLRSHALPDEETCLCFFSARRREDVEEVNRRADAAYERVVTVLTLDGDD
jgi:Protein of unknown function (DUF4242)